MRKIDSTIKFIIDPVHNPPPTDWGKIEKSINHHRLFHFMEDIFKIYSDVIPLEIKARLKKNYIYELQRQYQLAAELTELCRKFDQAGLNYICLKGPALAIQLYGSLQGRVSRDLDFLIKEEDVSEFLKLLFDCGYQITQSKKSIKPEDYRKLKKDQHLINKEKRILVELHWRLFTNKHFFPVVDKLMEDPDKVSVLNYQVPVMNRENHFFYLCMHGIYHEFFRLFWLRDIAEADLRWKPDRERVLTLASLMKMKRVISSAVFLADIFFNPLPEPSDKISERGVRKIVNHCIKIINQSSALRKIDRLNRIFYFMRLKKGMPYKVECLTGVVKRFKTA